MERLALAVGGAHVAPVAAQLLTLPELAYGRMLLGVAAEGLDPVGVVVELAKELGLGDGQVVALEVVVDVDLPVALDQVLTRLDEAHALDVVTDRPYLVRYRAEHVA